MTDGMFDRVAKRKKQSGERTEQQSQESTSKRKNPDYKQFGIYIKKDVHLKVKTKATAQQLELSQLIEDLLIEWLDE